MLKDRVVEQAGIKPALPFCNQTAGTTPLVPYCPAELHRASGRAGRAASYRLQLIEGNGTMSTTPFGAGGSARIRTEVSWLMSPAL